MSNLAAVVSGLATTLSTGLSGTAIGGRIFAYGVDAPNPPTAIVIPAPEDPVVFGDTYDGQDSFNLVIKVLMGSQDDRANQAELMSYLARSGTGSIFAILAASPTLGGAVSYAIVTRATAYGDIEWAGQIYYGAELIVEAMS